ncbi:MAG: serine/threonine protein kinase [Firmicutes bacterium]|nr:serine/threonine protein kinase [Bacillota bacterium]
MFKKDEDKHKPGDLLNNRYVIISRVGGGGQSVVFLAEDKENNNNKVIIKTLVFQSFSRKHREEELRLFSREAEILEKIKHPLLPELYDFFEENGTHSIAEQYIEGKSLEKCLHSTESPFDSKQVLEFLRDMLSLLEVFHNQTPPVIIRDIKPGNIIIDPENKPHIVDFSISREHKPGKGDTIRMGSPGYAPPEQYKGMTDPRSDIYALGATAYQMITRFDPAQKPFSLPDIKDLNPDASNGLAEIIRKAIAMDPENRYQTVVEMKNDVEKLLTPEKSASKIKSAGKKAEGAKAGAKAEKTGQVSAKTFLKVAVCVGLMLLGWTVFRLIERNREAKKMQMQAVLTCTSNLFEISIALENYAKNNNGEYPSNLRELVPSYLTQMPACPAAEKDTYSESYELKDAEKQSDEEKNRSKSGKTYKIYCRGHYHQQAGIDQDRPMLEKGKGIR